MTPLIISRQSLDASYFVLDIHSLADSDYAHEYRLSDAARRDRIDRYRVDDDKRRTLAGRILARWAVAQTCGMQEDDIIFAASDSGKPRVSNADAEISIAHSGRLVACAVSDRPIGIDIELIKPFDPKLARRIFDETELAELFGHMPTEADFAAMPDTEMTDRFYRIWTAKEAYFKCIGTGIIKLRTGAVPRYKTEKISLPCGEDYIMSVYKKT